MLAIIDTFTEGLTIHEVEDEVAEATGSGVQRYLIIALAIALALSLLAFLREKRIVDRSSEDKHYRFEWNTAGTELSVVHKAQGVAYTRYIDDNADFNYERLEVYTDPQVLGSVSVDADEDGFFEKTIFYSAAGDYAGMSVDTAGNRFSEFMEFVLESGDTIRFTDRNRNGMLELSPAH